jgi:hypothetical protein
MRMRTSCPAADVDVVARAAVEVVGQVAVVKRVDPVAGVEVRGDVGVVVEPVVAVPAVQVDVLDLGGAVGPGVPGREVFWP